LILTDREIKISIENDLIGVDPRPGQDAYSSTALDLTLDRAIRTFKGSAPGLYLTIDPGQPGYSFQKALPQLTELGEIGEGGFDLKPNRLLLAWTRERIELKATSRIAARVEGKSSLARIGLGIHVTAPTIHAGFKGNIQLEIVNHGAHPIRLRSGMKVCQLIFEQTLGVPEAGYQGQFAGQLASP
jgi:dCTP deaminase